MFLQILFEEEFCINEIETENDSCQEKKFVNKCFIFFHGLELKIDEWKIIDARKHDDQE